MSTSIKAILFDMDGVIVDSEAGHAAATSTALVRAGLEPLSIEAYEQHFFGRTDRSSFGPYLELIGRPDLSADLLCQWKADAYADLAATQLTPLDDGITTLREAHAAGFRIAIVSGALEAEVQQVVRAFELERYIEATVSGDDVPDGKPNPAPYLLGAQRLDVRPDECLVIEDAAPGIASARAAGMLCLAVDRLGRPEQLAAADRVVPELDLATITDLIQANTR